MGTGVGAMSLVSVFMNSTRSFASSFDMDKIRPGMPKEELERARQEIARVAMQMTPTL